MIARRPFQRHDHRCLSWRVRRHEGLALLVLAFLVVPGPGVVAQAAPRQQPAELWRQFPLDPERSTPQSPAERELAPSSARTGGSAGEDRQGSLVTTQFAAIVLAIAIVLMLATARAYATRGTLELGSRGRRRRLIRPFTNVIHRSRAALNSGRQSAIRSSPPRHRLRGAAEPLAIRATAADLSASLVSEVGALRNSPNPFSVPAGNKGRLNEVRALERRLEMYSAPERSDRSLHDESESLKAKANTQGSLAKSDDSAEQAEVETLKQKLAVQHARSDSPRGDLQALKDKLDGEPVGTKLLPIPHSELETLRAKLGEHEQHERFNGERRFVPGDARSREPERETPANVPGEMSRRAARRNATFSSDSPAASVDAHSLADPPTVKATESHAPAASSAQALQVESMRLSRVAGMGAKVLRLLLLLLVIGLLLLNIAVLFDLGVVS
jgi:hypothetical protein